MAYKKKSNTKKLFKTQKKKKGLPLVCWGCTVSILCVHSTSVTFMRPWWSYTHLWPPFSVPVALMLSTQFPCAWDYEKPKVLHVAHWRQKKKERNGRAC